MAKKKQKQGVLTLSKDNIIYQPLSLAKSGYGATALEQNIVIAVLKKLKACFKAIRDGQFASPPKQLSLFNLSEVKENYISRDELAFEIHMKDLGIEPKYYQQAFNTIFSVADSVVFLEKQKEDGSTIFVRDHFFKVASDNMVKVKNEDGTVTYRYANRTPKFEVIFSKAVADYIFDPTSRIYDFLDETALMIAEKYPKRLYMYLSNYKKIDGGLTVNYWTFRHDIGLMDKPVEGEGEPDIQYAHYYDFNKRVLRPSQKKLMELAEKELSDFWFEYEPIYKGSRKAKNPDQLHFTFHLTGVGQSIEKENKSTREMLNIRVRLIDEFNQTPAQANKLMSNIDVEQADIISQKLDSLANYFAEKGGTIKDKRSYTNKSLTDFIATLKTDNQQEIPLSDDAVVVDKVAESDNNDYNKSEGRGATILVPVLSEEAKSKWNTFFEELHERLNVKRYEFWKSSVRLWDYEDNKVTVVLPNEFFMKEFKKFYVAEIHDSFEAAFGEEGNMNFFANVEYFKLVENN